MSDGTLYDHTDLYDLVMGANPAAEAFYIQEARQRGTSVLALACGSGRFSIPMAKSGLNVVGGDLSTTMLERAHAKAVSEGVHIPLLQMDMRDFSLPGREFNFIFIAANSLLHLHEADHLRSCFRSIARHLAPGGAVGFDVFVPSAQMLARGPDQRHLVGASCTGHLEN